MGHQNFDSLRVAEIDLVRINRFQVPSNYVKIGVDGQTFKVRVCSNGPPIETFLFFSSNSPLPSSSILNSRAATGSEMLSLSPEQVSLSACNFTYANFHLIWTIPQTLVLFVLARPFLTPLDNAKLILLPLIAFLWTTPWDSELIRSRAWAYPRDCVLFSVYRIPVEEYFFVSPKSWTEGRRT